MPPIFHTDTHSVTDIGTEKEINASVISGDVGTSAEMGTYMLRRAHYFNNHYGATVMPDRSASVSFNNGHR
jgi:hypothetical protein